MQNAISIDLEDWFCAYNLRMGVDVWGKQELRVRRNTDILLKLLQKHETQATFFVLGWIAEQAPDLIKEIEAAGHEIGVHSYSHALITHMTPEQFKEDLVKALDTIRPLVRQPLKGYRAPSFSVTEKTLWALDILAAHGFAYDSSIFPIGYHPDYGIADAPLEIHKRGRITEVPLSVAEVMGRRIACSGGGYFRLLPYALSKFLIQRCNAQGRPVIFYLHPWEIDAGQPRKKLPFLKHLRHYSRLGSMETRLDRLLTDFTFVPINRLVEV